jgi:hypothetical protein
MGYKILDAKADIHEDVEAYFNERPDWDALLPPYVKMEQIKAEVLDIVDEHFEKIESKWATNGQLDD